MRSTHLHPPYVALFALFGLSLGVMALACSSTTGSGSGGAGGSGSGAGGTGGASSSSGGMAGMNGSGGMGGDGGMIGGGGEGGSGGGTGCVDECVTNADCPMPLTACSKTGSQCTKCFGPCGVKPCMGQNTCVSDADCNASPDARCVCSEQGCTICVLSLPGGPPGFPNVLDDGVWLIGWSGGLDHYSWVKFVFQTATTGTFTLLDPMGVTLTSYYMCEGSGAFSTDLGTGVVTLELPAACGMAKSILDFESFFSPGGFPPHATMGANIKTMGQYIQGFQHDAGFCDQNFTACGDPFQP